jgi:L-cystine uptake protein TcyP (sodium:dicarboxylate symporter family)
MVVSLARATIPSNIEDIYGSLNLPSITTSFIASYSSAQGFTISGNTVLGNYPVLNGLFEVPSPDEI